MRITFLNPASDADPFYRKMVQFGRLAAADLGVDFQVLEAGRDLDRMRGLARGLIQGRDRPDYLLLVNDRDVAAELLPELDEAGIRSFLTVEGFLLAEKQQLGSPRERLPNWLGGLLPDDEQAGYLLTEALIDLARHRELVADDGRLHILGLSGAYSVGSILRLNGLRRAIVRHPDVVLDEVAPALWQQEQAALLTPELLARNPGARVIWAASDSMAAGAVEGLEEAGRRPGREILVGGIDWSPRTLERIGSGVFAVSVGGHFLDAAWAVVRLYDHHHGSDFEPPIARSSFSVLTRDNSDRYRPLFDEARWSGIRFSRLSRAARPDLPEYELGVETMLGLL